MHKDHEMLKAVEAASMGMVARLLFVGDNCQQGEAFSRLVMSSRDDFPRLRQSLSLSNRQEPSLALRAGFRRQSMAVECG